MTLKAARAPLSFDKVESLRKHMLLSVGDLADLLGVSRPTYYAWVKGGPIRTANDDKVRTTLRRLLAVMNEHSWPTPQVIASDQKTRKALLDEILNG